jgi:hypothetical protein
VNNLVPHLDHHTHLDGPDLARFEAWKSKRVVTLGHEVRVYLAYGQ